MAERNTNVYGAVGLFGVLLFASTLVVLHVVHPEIDWPRHYVSDFVNERIGWLFVVAALIHGSCNLVLTLGLRAELERSWLRVSAVLCFAFAALGIVLAALFPTDPGGQAVTVTGLTHRIAVTSSFLVELVAVFLFSWAMMKSPRWRHGAVASFAWSIVAALALTSFFLAVAWKQFPGLAERFALGTFLIWEFAASLVLLRAGTHVEPIAIQR